MRKKKSLAKFPKSDSLMSAIRRGDAAGVREALKAGASPSATGSDSLTPLALAARLNAAECAEELVSALEKLGPGSARSREGVCDYPKVNGAAQKNKGVSALQEAARYGSLECVRLFAARGWDLEETGLEGRTALSWACARVHADVARELARLGARAEGLERDLLVACHQKRVDIAEVLLSAGCPLEAADDYGRSALMVAADKKDINLGELLIGYGASVEAKDRTGETALHIAARRNDAKFATLLVSAGANPLEKNDLGKTAVDISIWTSDESHWWEDFKGEKKIGQPNEAGRAIEVFMDRVALSEEARPARARSPGKSRL